MRNRPREFWPAAFPFTCGPAALGALMSGYGWSPSGDRIGEELTIWRESTAVACPFSHPYGLALAARNRGFLARIDLQGPHPFLWEHIRTHHPSFHRSLYVEIERRLEQDCESKGIVIRVGRDAVPGGDPGLLLMRSPRPDRGRYNPHWILVARADEGSSVADPFRRTEYESRCTLEDWWSEGGYLGTRCWIAIRPLSERPAPGSARPALVRSEREPQPSPSRETLEDIR